MLIQITYSSCKQSDKLQVKQLLPPEVVLLRLGAEGRLDLPHGHNLIGDVNLYFVLLVMILNATGHSHLHSQSVCRCLFLNETLAPVTDWWLCNVFFSHLLTQKALNLLFVASSSKYLEWRSKGVPNRFLAGFVTREWLMDPSPKLYQESADQEWVCYNSQASCVKPVYGLPESHQHVHNSRVWSGKLPLVFSRYVTFCFILKRSEFLGSLTHCVKLACSLSVVILILLTMRSPWVARNVIEYGAVGYRI